MTIIPISVRYNLEDDESQLDVYDAGVALSGLSRSMSVATHYLINRAVTKQAPSLSGAKIYLQPARAGSFVFDLSVIADPGTFLGAMTAGVAAGVFYDYIKYIFKRTIGQDHDPDTESVRSIVNSDDGAIDTVVDTIEGDLASVHRPIIHNARNVVIFNGDNNMVRLDSQTYDYVKAKITSEDTEVFVGNVSSFNANSGRGRLFVRDIGRTVPFSSEEDEFSDDEKALLAWSLNEYVNGRPGLIDMEATYVSTPGGLLKSLNVREIGRH